MVSDNKINDLSLSATFKLTDGVLTEELLATLASTVLASGSNAAPAAASRAGHYVAGTLIDDKYRIDDLIGKGGMGVVYKAHHIMLNKEVALKTIICQHLLDDAWNRFEREARAVARLENQHIVRVFDFGVANEQPYYTMELLNGHSLDNLLAKVRCLDVNRAVQVFTQVALGLVSAHNKKIIHRDLKPANIFIEQQTKTLHVIKVVDFGLAKLLGSTDMEGQRLTTVGTIFGSPLYMSPEQSRGENVDERSDIYSFACTFYQALTGRPPYVSDTALSTIYMHQQEPIPSLKQYAPGKDFPEWLETLIADMLEKDKDDRIQSFEEILEIIDFNHESSRQAIDTDFVAYTPTGQTGAWLAHTRRKGRFDAIKLAALLTGICGIAATAYYFDQDSKQKSAPPKTVPAQTPPVASLVEPEQTPFFEESAPLTKNSVDSKISNGYYTAQSVVFSAADLRTLSQAKFSKLIVEHCQFDNDGFVYLAALPLEKLNVTDTNFDDTGAAALPKYKHLTSLLVSNTKLSAAGLKKLTQCKPLVKLYVEFLKLNDEFMASLPQLKNLKMLSLYGCTGVTAANFQHLKGCDIHFLRLSLTAADDSWLKTLNYLPKLERIEFTQTKITTAGVRQLCEKVKSLRFIDLANCPGIHSRDIISLRRQFPGIQFFSDEYPDPDTVILKLNEKIK